MSAEKITVRVVVRRPLEDVWRMWTAPRDIEKWNSASDDWHTPWAENDLRVGGIFRSRMEAKDGSFGFDFSGIYDEVVPLKRIAYTMPDGRKVAVDFEPSEDGVRVTEVFDAEATNPASMQRDGWQAILEHFKRHAEAN
jgi:uncharacterized protein YndB with AHSA1/START domain